MFDLFINLFWFLMCFAVSGVVLIAATFMGCVVYILIRNALNVVKKKWNEED